MSVRLEAGKAALSRELAVQPFPAGAYEMHWVCVGSGSVGLQWSAGDVVVHTARVVCGAGAAQAVIELSAPEVFRLVLTPDEQAQGRAAVAVALTDPLIIAVESALNRQAVDIDSNAGGSGFAGSRRRDVAQVSIVAGRYTLSVTCSGRGWLRATFAIGSASATGTVPCSAEPQLVRVPLTVRRSGVAEQVVIIDPDDQAKVSVGFAFAISAG